MRIKTRLGEVFEGSPEEIVKEMAESAFAQDQGTVAYKEAYSRRARKLLGESLDVRSARAFLHSLLAAGEIEIEERSEPDGGSGGQLPGEAVQDDGEGVPARG